MWYIYNSDGIIIATASLEPDRDDLASRGESAFEDKNIYHCGWWVVFENGVPVRAVPDGSRTGALEMK